MTVVKKSIFNMLSGFLGQFIIIALGIIIPRLVLVSFGSEVNGLLNSASQIFTFFNLFEAGIGVACLQALYAPVANNDKNVISSIMVATDKFYRKTGILYAVSVVILALCYPFLVSTELSYGLIVAVILFGGIGNSLNFLFQGKYKILMQAQGYSYVSTNITTIINIMINLSKAILLTLGFGVIEVQISGFVISVVQMLIYYVYIKNRYAWIDFKAKADDRVLEQKNATLVHQISNLVFGNTDMVLLTIITRSLKVVSIYSMYFLVTNSMLLLLQQFPAAIDFRLGQIYNTDKKRYFPLYHIAETAYIIIAFSAMGTVFILLIPFIRLYTAGINDADYINSLYPLMFVIAPILTMGRFTPLNLINHAGHFKKTQWRAVAETGINLVVSVFGIYLWGIPGALLGTIIATLYRTNDMILYCYKYLIKSNPIITYKRWIGAIIVFIPIMLLVNTPLEIDSYVNIVIYGIVIGIVLLLVNTLVQAIINIKELKEFIKIFIKRS